MYTTIRFEDQINALCVDLGLDLSDCDYLQHRFKNEGVKFLTVTLPKLSKEVIASIEKGFFDRSELTDFRWKGRSLHFMWSSLSLIFTHDGLVNPDHHSVSRGLSVLRQLCEYWYKIAFSFSEDELQKAEKEFVEDDERLARTNVNWSQVDHMRKLFETHFSLSRLTIDDMFASNRPRVTSGSFARSTVHSEPYYVRKHMPAEQVGTCPKGLAAFSGFFRPYPSSKDRINLVEEERTCEVLFVPKDSRGPRVIAKEPLLHLAAQMSYYDTVTDSVAASTSGRIQFKDQEKFRVLAREGSVNREWSTLDLRKASDSVLLSVCKALFRNSPAVRYVINNIRSTHASLPSGRVIKLNKLGSMGAGVTFSTMALVIYLAVVSRIMCSTNLSYDQVGHLVHVYGDDIIIPTEHYDRAIAGLQDIGLLVNTSKSFRLSHFRESCGGDYYHGVDVGPVRLRLHNAKLGEARSFLCSFRRKSKHSLPIRLNNMGILELERHCRELRQKGLYALSEYYYAQLESTLGTLPYVAGDSPVIGRYDPHGVNLFTERAWFPVPYSIGTDKVCPLKHLGRFLSRKEPTILPSKDWKELIECRFDGSSYGDVSVPRMIKLVRRKVCHLQKISNLMS